MPELAETSFDRSDALHSLRTDTFDLVVIGGGITGAGVALDAAARGLRTALIEGGDFASGTSSKSSKLVHGGLRYLQQGDVSLVYEALHERRRLLSNAPHLVDIQPFLLPLFAKGGLVPKKLARSMGAAMWAYDVTGGWRIGRFHQRIDTDEAIAHMPTLPADKIGGAYLYYDASADDARLVLTVIRSAVLDHGATAANRVRALGLHKTPGRVIDGVEVEADGERFTIATTAVVNAGGVFADDVRALDEATHPKSIRPAKGIHVTVPWDRVRNDVGVILPVKGDRRSVFVMPWGDHTYVGTTDTTYDGPVDDPRCTPEDVAYLLDAVNGWTGAGLTPDDVTGTWAGLRPLIAGSENSGGRTADLSRRHQVLTSPSGMVTVTGGKLTTYRQMAADAVDEVIDSLLGPAGVDVARKSPTARLRLRGADGWEHVAGAAESVGLSRETGEHLARRYGGDARPLLDDVAADPSLAEPMVSGLPYLRAEARHSVRFEMATTLVDLLSRRTRALLLDREATRRAAPAVAADVAPLLGWDDAETARQVADFEAIVDAELAAEAGHRIPAGAPTGTRA
ncbi:MAG: glycerol-3-phosphate dehydrogenase/oxidase [Microthrixaceae bacterium]|nr:glycerol-3-phosphate dehydrogenase/oxidase [Microthrixaceae bacterium]